MKIASVRFPAQWHSPEPAPAQGVRFAGLYHREECVEFKLGPGPCGKEVVRLDAYWQPCEGERHERLFQIEQRHSDGTSKVFLYQYRDILGRIEIEYSK